MDQIATIRLLGRIDFDVKEHADSLPRGKGVEPFVPSSKENDVTFIKKGKNVKSVRIATGRCVLFHLVSTV